MVVVLLVEVHEASITLSHSLVHGQGLPYTNKGRHHRHDYDDNKGNCAPLAVGGLKVCIVLTDSFRKEQFDLASLRKLRLQHAFWKPQTGSYGKLRHHPFLDAMNQVMVHVFTDRE